jgi:hypothetical protein
MKHLTIALGLAALASGALANEEQYYQSWYGQSLVYAAPVAAANTFVAKTAINPDVKLVDEQSYHEHRFEGSFVPKAKPAILGGKLIDEQTFHEQRFTRTKA